MSTKVDINAFMIELAKLAKHQAKKKPTPKVTAPNKRKLVRHSTAAFTAEEKERMMKLFRLGRSKKQIAKLVHRGKQRVAKFIDSQINVPSAPTKKPDIIAITPPSLDDITGLGPVKRSLERLHDRITKVDTLIEAHRGRLGDISGAIAKLQQSVDRITREFVTTNPPPAELIMPAPRNGHAK